MWLQKFWYKTLGKPFKLHVTKHGDPKKPVIILLHGIAVDSQSWSKVLPYLTPDYYCITIDLLGFGHSPKPDWIGYTMDDHVNAVVYTLKKLKLPKKYILMGHSLGSFISTRVALRMQRHIKQLYLLSPPVYPPLKDIKSGTARWLTALLLATYSFLRSDKVSPALLAKVTRISPFPDNVIRNPASWKPAVLTLEHCIEQQTILKDARELSIPTHVFYGLYDQFVIKSNVKFLAKNSNITMHPFMNDHQLTRHYGAVLAAVLAKKPLPKRRAAQKKKTSSVKNGDNTGQANPRGNDKK